jgi:hypothetical protein
MNKTTLNNIAILISILTILLAGFFFGKFVYNKPITIQEIVYDTLFVYRDTIMADIETNFLNWDSISDSGVDFTQTFPIQTNDGISYEIAKLDTTFHFSDSTWHRIQIQYDEFYNKFIVDSKFRVYEAIDYQSMLDHQPMKKTPLTPFLTASMAIGNENEKKYSVLGLGVGIKWKKVGVGIEAFSNKTAGGFLTYEF